MNKWILTGCLLAAAGVFAADAVLLSLDAEKENGWNGGAVITTEEAHSGNAAYLARGRKRLTVLKKIDIDPERKYRDAHDIECRNRAHEYHDGQG